MAKKKNKLSVRESPAELLYREAAIVLNERGVPATLDEPSRTVEVIAATENPAMVWDYERGEVVNEILLMSGLTMPPSRQVPLLDSHQRYETANVIGSVRNLRIENDKLVGRDHFSTAPEAEGPWTKVREGHLTDHSVGYRVERSKFVEAGESETIEGRTFEGPVKVGTRWSLREISVVPIGADEAAKIRGEVKKPEQEEIKMNAKLRAALEARGLNPKATEDEAWAFLAEAMGERKEPEKKEPAQPEKVDVAAEKRQAMEAERERCAEIDALCVRHQVDPDTKAKFVKEGTPLDDVRAAILELMIKNTPEPVTEGGRVEVGTMDAEKRQAAIQDSLMIRGSLITDVTKAAPGALDFAGYSLTEIARECLRMKGHNVRGTKMELMGRALTTSDFPIILSNVANKSLFTGWDTAGETWSQWCGTGDVADFKTHTSVRASELTDLEEIPEGSEYQYGDMDEAQEQYSIATYGKKFAITRQALINDDLGVFTTIPMKHGEASARKIGDVAYAVLTANAAMGDDVALFHPTSHGNEASGTTIDPPGIVTIAAGIFAMKSQKDAKGLRRLNIRPQFFIAPTEMEGASEVFFKSFNYSDMASASTDSSIGSTRVNPYSGSYFTRIYESRLDDDSSTRWYLATSPGKTVTVFFLQGNRTPYMETRPGWDVDGQEFKVRMDVGAKAMDWRGLYMNDGT